MNTLRALALMLSLMAVLTAQIITNPGGGGGGGGINPCYIDVAAITGNYAIPSGGSCANSQGSPQHNLGNYATAWGYSNATPKVFTSFNLTNDGSGNLTLALGGTTFSGRIVVTSLGTGAVGPTGAAGNTGPAGTNGTNGTNGAMPDPGGNGFMVRTALNTDTARTLAAGAGISISNADGTGGNPTITSTVTGPTTNQTIRHIGATFDGQGAPLATKTVCSEVDITGTISQATMTLDVSGNSTIRVLYATYAAYTGNASVATDLSNGGEVITGATKLQDATLTGWTTSISPGVFCFALSGPATATQARLDLKVTAN